jgi:hypothetical protein
MHVNPSGQAAPAASSWLGPLRPPQVPHWLLASSESCRCAACAPAASSAHSSAAVSGALPCLMALMLPPARDVAMCSKDLQGKPEQECGARWGGGATAGLQRPPRQRAAPATGMDKGAG